MYAVGDIVFGLQLAHRGFAHGIFVAEEVAHRLGRLATAPVLVPDVEIPRVTYCDPEIASVGLSEEAARAAYGDVETLTYDLGGQRQVPDPQDPGLRQAGPPRRRPGRRRAHDRRPGRRS